MSRRPSAKTSWFSVVLVIAAAALWLLDQKRAVENHAPASHAQSAGAYETHSHCSLVEARNNDGDSFVLRLPGGRQAEFRLYFVDAPESAFKSYPGGHTNHERIRQQAADLGGITSQQAVETGRQAKAFTLGLLERGPVTIFTRWDSPFHDGRYHAFVRISGSGTTRWLHELLVERGLARIKTKPADLPDGTPAARQRDRLRALERAAKRKAAGVWAR